MKRRNMAAVILAAAASAAMAGTAWAGEWKSDERGWWYEEDSGNYASGTMVEIDGEWYSFGEQGYMLTGWLHKGDDWYYFDPDGARASGWRQVDGYWYYFDENGKMEHDSWRNYNGNTYYFHSNGQMAVNGFFEPAVKKEDRDYYWYYADQNGVIKKDAIEGNIKYGKSGRIYTPSKEDEDRWVPLATSEEVVEATMEGIEDKYLDEIGWSGWRNQRLAEEMEVEARQKLGSLISEEELETFITDLADQIIFLKGDDYDDDWY